MERLCSPTSVSEFRPVSEAETSEVFSSQAEIEKARSVQECLECDPVSLWDLRELALSEGGLVNVTLRRIAWPLLVGLTSRNRNHTTSFAIGHSMCEPRPCSNLSPKDLDLLQRDSTRSVFNKYKCALIDDLGNQKADPNLVSQDRSHDLLLVLASVLKNSTRYGSLRYFQGMHDIAAVLIFNLADNDGAIAVLQRICSSHLRESLRDDDFLSLLYFLKVTLLPLLQIFDPELHDILSLEEVMLPTLILPWIITWCLHDISDPKVASRLVDALLCGHSTFILYLVIALLIAGRDPIIDCTSSGDDDVMSIVTCIKSLPSRIMSDYSEDGKVGFRAQDLIDRALNLLHKVQPRSLLSLIHERSSGQSMKSTLSFFCRAVPSWALSSFPDQNLRLIPQQIPRPRNLDRAKVASGATHLIRSVVLFPKELSKSSDSQKKTHSWFARLFWFIQYLSLASRRRS